MIDALLWVGLGVVLGVSGLSVGLLAGLHFAESMNENGIAER